MEISYANKNVESLFTDYTRMKRQIGLEKTRSVKKHLDLLKAADDLGVYLTLRLGHPEQLKGYERIRYSVRITANDRLIFEPNATVETLRTCTEVKIVGVCDYHGHKDNWLIS